MKYIGPPVYAIAEPVYTDDPVLGAVIAGYACEDRTYRAFKYERQQPFVKIKDGYGTQADALQKSRDTHNCHEVLIFVEGVLKARRSIEEVMATEPDDLGRGLQWFVKPPEKAPLRKPRLAHLKRGT